MSQVTSKLTTVLAGLALASLPVLADAQYASPQQPTSRQNRTSRIAGPDTPQHHLSEARRVLTSINSTSLKGEARSRVNELKRHFTQLDSAWRKSGGTAGTAGSTTEQTTSGSTARQTPRTSRYGESAGTNDWMTHYQAIDTILDQLVGANEASISGHAGATAGTSGTTSDTTARTSGTTSATSGRTGEGATASADVNLSASVRSKLMEFRTHLEQFHTAAMGQTGGQEDPASASAQSGMPGSATGPARTTPYPTTGSPESTLSATGTAGTTATGTMTGATAQTATGTTGQTTAATQTTDVTGTAAIADTAAIARLTAQIDELLRGGASTTVAAGTTTGTGAATTGTTGSTTMTGTAGTTGTTSATGTVCVDRAKLEQLRRDIQALQPRKQ